MIKNSIFILLGGNNLMKIITFLINLEDNHPNSEVRILIYKQLRKTLQVIINEIDLNLNINIEYPDNEKIDIFYKSNYDFYLLDKLVKDNNVIIIRDHPYMQCGLPLNKFTKDFGGIEISDGVYSLDFAYFNSPSLVKDLINKLKDKYDKMYLPTIETHSALTIQKAWSSYLKKSFNKNIIETNLLKLKSINKKFFENKYEITDNHYDLDKLDYNILLGPNTLSYKIKVNKDLLKTEEGIITYKDEKCCLIQVPDKKCPVLPEFKWLVDLYIELLLQSRNNIRNNIGLWNGKAFNIKWCLCSFMDFLVRDEYLSNFLISTKSPNIYGIQQHYEPYIKLGCDNIYIYNYPTSAQFTPNLLSAHLIILAYPMQEKDISILDKYNKQYYYLGMNLPQSIKKIIEIQKLDLKKENELYSLGCHKLLISEDLDKEKKEYGEYLREISMAKYMIVYNDYKYNKCTQITEAIAFGTIPILVKQNNIIINNDNFKEGIHYISADIKEVENKIAAISEGEYYKLKQNCIDFYNKYESEKVFNKKLIRFFVSNYNNFIKF